MPGLELIQARIAAYKPILFPRGAETQEAAVALTLHQSPGASPEILFIERTVREGDPWSGQMAFPGGRRSPEDPDLCATAVRETFEEVDLSLGTPIGQLDDTHGGRADPGNRLIVSSFVFEIRERTELRLNHEVQDAVWVPVPHLLEARSAVEYEFEHNGLGGIFPGVRYKRYTVWGLTYRILGHFLEVLGHQLPPP
jgi:8-oxo-dGTP pyrophosphatase MutT (NUDIX family)